MHGLLTACGPAASGGGVTFGFLGDSALLIRVEGHPSLSANAVVHRLADAVRHAALPGIRDVVPGMCELVVHLDPLGSDVALLEASIREWAASAEAGDEARTAPGALVEVAVQYGGPDLEQVADSCGLVPDEVCRRHAAVEYVVCFTGFLPGFAYLGGLDPMLRLPRRATPRPRVEAGSVAIADGFAGIYPSASPGGWHVIGHTDARLFDLDADPPALLVPGGRVRFVPASGLRCP